MKRKSKEHPFRVVVDANVILSCLISGNTAQLIFSPRIELFAPEFMLIEIKRHKGEILKKSKLSDDEFELLFLLIEKHIQIVQKSYFIHLLPKARQLMREHLKDVPYIALALFLDCPFWSYEKRFSKLAEVKTLSTSEISEKLRKR